MTNIEKTKQLINDIYPSTSMGDYGLKEMLVMKAMEWKDEQMTHTIRQMFNCIIMAQDHTLSNKDNQYIDIDVLQQIIEDFFKIKVDL